MTVKFQFSITGVDPLVRKLKAFNAKTGRRILRASLRTSVNPLARELRKGIRRDANLTGTSARSVIAKVVTFASGVIYAVVGVKNQKVGNVNPANIIHLFDGGVRAHKFSNSGRFRATVRGATFGSALRYWRRIPGGLHPGISPKKIREHAALRSQSAVGAAFNNSFDSRLRKELKK